MKIFTLIILLLCGSINSVHSQAICDSIRFYSDTIYVNQVTDDSITVKFDYNWTVNPTIVYPSFYVSLSDTSNLIINQEFIATFLGQQDSIAFKITYKNPTIPAGYSVAGSFDIHDPNSNPTLICQFSVVLVFTTPLSIENKAQQLSINIYPNPFSDRLNVDTYQSNFKELYITDIFGNSLLHLLSSEIREINMSEFQTGIYILTVVDEHDRSTSKRIVKLPYSVNHY